MFFIIAASSLHHALQTLTSENQKSYIENIYSVPGLSLNVNTKSPKTIVQNLLLKDNSEKTDIVIWQDVLNDSIFKYETNIFRPLTVWQLLNILKSLKKPPSSSVLPPTPYPEHFAQFEGN